MPIGESGMLQRATGRFCVRRNRLFFAGFSKKMRWIPDEKPLREEDCGGFRAFRSFESVRE